MVHFVKRSCQSLLRLFLHFSNGAMPHLLNRCAVTQCNDGAVTANGPQVGVCDDGSEVRLCALWHPFLQLQEKCA